MIMLQLSFSPEGEKSSSSTDQNDNRNSCEGNPSFAPADRPSPL
jgi:hypothetical protein